MSMAFKFLSIQEEDLKRKGKRKKFDEDGEVGLKDKIGKVNHKKKRRMKH